MSLALVLAALLHQAPAAPPVVSPSRDAPRPALPAPRIEVVEPPFPLPAPLRDSIRFGYIQVPRDHASPGGPTFRIAIAILSAHTTDPEPDPLVFVPGGPGEAVIETEAVRLARSPRIDLLRRRRAFIILEPRGHGLSEPNVCEELNASRPLVDGLARAEALLARELTACRRRLVDDGVTLKTVSSAAVAHDIGLLRDALGAPRLNLIGGSYGTRIVLEAMRQVPSAIRAVNLNGPVPAGAPYLADDARTARDALRVLLDRCAAQPQCRRQYPRLETELDSLLESVRRRPLLVRLPRSEQLPDDTVRLGEELLGRALAELLMARELIAGAPLLIHGLAVHGGELLTSLAPRLTRELTVDLRFGTHLAFQCNDVPLHAEPEWLRTRCSILMGERHRSAGHEPVKSDVPALILAGEFDPRTPPAYGRTAGGTLSRSHVVVIPWYGHDFRSDCAFRITRDFFDAPERPPETSCLDSIPPVTFVTGVVPTRWISRAVSAIARHPIGAGAPVGAAFVLLLIPVAWVSARGRAWRAEPDRESPTSAGGMARRLLGLAAAAGLLLLIATGLALLAGARQHFLVPAIGVPRGWRWVLGLPWLLLGTGMAALAASRHARASALPPLVRWSAWLGMALTLGLWAFHAFA